MVPGSERAGRTVSRVPAGEGFPAPATCGKWAESCAHFMSHHP